MTAPSTPKQVAQLQALHAAGAVDLVRAVGPYDGVAFNPMVLGKLRDMGLVDSKVLRPGARRGDGSTTGGQQTVYWLTASGAREAAR